MAPMRLDPPLHLELLVKVRESDLDDPAVHDARGVVVESKGDGLGFLLLLRLRVRLPGDGLRLLRPVGGKSGVIRCLLDGDARRGVGDDGRGWG